MTAKETADRWHALFARRASDLYPGRYTPEIDQACCRSSGGLYLGGVAA
jgi:hypothetical protein